MITESQYNEAIKYINYWSKYIITWKPPNHPYWKSMKIKYSQQIIDAKKVVSEYKVKEIKKVKVNEVKFKLDTSDLCDRLRKVISDKEKKVDDEYDRDEQIMNEDKRRAKIDKWRLLQNAI